MRSDALERRVEALAQFGFECRFIDDESTLMWSKLVFLAPHALSTTATGLAIGQVISDPQHMTELAELVHEACAVAVASEAKVQANAVLEIFRTLPPEMRSSMQKDVERGRAPELDAIAGPILRGAETYGLKAAVTKRLVQQIEARIG